MELEAQKLLKQIIARYGTSVIDDPQRFTSLLNDLRKGEHKREAHLINLALKDGVAARLLGSSQHEPVAVLLDRLVHGLVDDHGLADDAARWAVGAWAVALGVVAEMPPAPVISPAEPVIPGMTPTAGLTAPEPPAEPPAVPEPNAVTSVGNLRPLSLEQQAPSGPFHALDVVLYGAVDSIAVLTSGAAGAVAAGASMVAKIGGVLGFVIGLFGYGGVGCLPFGIAGFLVGGLIGGVVAAGAIVAALAVAGAIWAGPAVVVGALVGSVSDAGWVVGVLVLVGTSIFYQWRLSLRHG